MSDPQQLPIFCADCGATGAVSKVTANLQCRCGSTNLGLQGVDDATGQEPTGFSAEAMAVLQHTAAPHGPGTGWVGADPRRYDGSSEYPGPRPQVVHRDAPVAVENQGVCPVCHGTGRDPVSDRSACRNCGGSGQDPTHPTGGPNPQFGESRDPGRALPPGGAHWASRANPSWRMVQDYYALDLDSGPLEAFSRTGSALDSYVSQFGVSRYGNENDQQLRQRLGNVIDRAVGRAASKDQPSGFTQEAQQRVAGKVVPNSVEDHIRSSTPGYTERGYSAPTKPFNPSDAETFYPKADTRGPHVKDWTPSGAAPDGPYRMDAAACPNCGTMPTHLEKDKNEDAWWTCKTCGPLANIDRNPEVNPYSPPQGFQPDRSMKTGGFLSRNRKTGQLLRVLAVIHDANELGEQEAVGLARETVRRSGESR